MSKEERRPRRRTNSRYGTTTVPSAVHYVGYVEDDETPEMIMSKFQELEEIQRREEKSKELEENGETNKDGDHQLTDDQLLQVFKQTSMFNVKTALQNNAMLAGIDDVLELTHERYGEDDIISDDEDMLRSFWSDDDDWEEAEYKKKGSRSRGKKPARQKLLSKVRHRVVTAYNPSTQALVRRRIKVADPNAIQFIRIPPPPIPLSWGRVIAPYTPPKQERTAGCIKVPDMKMLSASMLPESVAEAVLVNSTWYRGYTHDDAMKRISSVSFKSLVPYGFIFVWTPKELVHPVCKLMQTHGYAYIENLTWVWMEPNNTIAKEDSEYVRRSHLTLYMFRAIDRIQNIELRHQRSPDVIFDYQKDGDMCPLETYSYIEILLPQSKGKLVELWGTVEENDRPGWAVVTEQEQGTQ